MDLLTINEIATMLKTSEGVAKQIMGDTPYLHLGTGKGRGREFEPHHFHQKNRAVRHKF